MKLGMNLQPRMRLICVICERDLHDHDPNCIQTAVDQVTASPSYRHEPCPVCRDRHGLGINDCDHWECRKCGALFDSSQVDHGGEEMIILAHDDDVIQVTHRPFPGTGIFPLDVRLRELVEERERLRNLACNSEIGE